MTFKILNASTNKIISRNYIRPADNDKSLNLRTDSFTSPEVTKSLHDDHVTITEDTDSNDHELPSSSK